MTAATRPKRGNRSRARADCRSCGTSCIPQGRGLCGRCWKVPHVREKYKPVEARCLACGSLLTSNPAVRRPDGLCKLCGGGSQGGDVTTARLREAGELAAKIIEPCGPSGYPPGSVGKLAVLCARAEANAAYGRTRSLFHPGDWKEGDLT